MINKESKNARRERRQFRARKKIHGTEARPRLSVFRSNQNISAQIIDDIQQHTLVAASSLEPDIRKEVGELSQTELAKRVGLLIAERALEKGIKTIVFDRSGYPFHGNVKAVADAAREKGLVF